MIRFQLHSIWMKDLSDKLCVTMANPATFRLHFMRHATKIVAIQLTAALFVSARPQSLPTKREANRILQETIKSQDLTADGTRPYHLLAKVRYESGGTESTGIYEIFWARPDRFREDFRLEKMAETDVALGSKLYAYRNTPTLTLQFLRLRNFVFRPISLFLGVESKVRQVYSDATGDKLRTCLNPSENPSNKICVDPATNQAVSVVMNNGKQPGQYELKEDDFVFADGRNYPRHTIRRINGVTWEVKLEKLESVTAFDAEVFSPPTNAEARDWCPHPAPKPGYFFSTAPFSETNPPGAFFPYYILTGKDGHIEKFVSLNPSAPPVSGSVANWIRGTQFPISVCGASPIESELIGPPGFQ